MNSVENQPQSPHPLAAPLAEAAGVDPIMQFFAFWHLPPQLREVSEPFAILALGLVGSVPRNAERTVALRKLLEAKDAGVRARLFK
jgi:hypothetical protein